MQCHKYRSKVKRTLPHKLKQSYLTPCTVTHAATSSHRPITPNQITKTDYREQAPSCNGGLRMLGVTVWRHLPYHLPDSNMTPLLLTRQHESYKTWL